MGQTSSTIAFHANADSPTGDGLKSVVSDPIATMTADEFWSLFTMDLRSRHQPPPETSGWDPPETENVEEGLFIVQPARGYEWWFIRGADEAECYSYCADASSSKLESRSTLRVHRDTFRIEFWSFVYGQRESGERLRRVMAKILQTMPSNAQCSHDVDSPGGNGLKCVLSEPILDSLLSPDQFWKQTKELIKRSAERILPDGGIVQKASSGGWELFQAEPLPYTKYIFHDAKWEIVSYTYSSSELSDRNLETVRHLRIHQRPYRLEMWMACADKRQAGHTEKQLLMRILGPVLEQVKLIEACPDSAADTAELSRLHDEVSAFRKEISDALDALHEGAGALKAL